MKGEPLIAIAQKKKKEDREVNALAQGLPYSLQVTDGALKPTV